MSPGTTPQVGTLSNEFGGGQACNDAFLFAARSSDTTKGSAANQIWALDRSGKQPARLLYRAAFAGSLERGANGEPIPGATITLRQAAGDWLVFEEYQQQGTSPSLRFWAVRALSLEGNFVVDVARATVAPATDALPRATVSKDGVVVWQERTPNGEQALRVKDLQKGDISTITLASGIMPIDPQLSGDTVVFLDSRTDPNRDREAWLARGGHLMTYNLASRELRTLDSTEDARNPRLTADHAAWYATVNGVWQVRLSRLDGSPSQALGEVGTGLQASRSHVVWHDFQKHQTWAFALSSKKSWPIQVADLQNPPSTAIPNYTLCGSTLYFNADFATKFVQLEN